MARAQDDRLAKFLGLPRGGTKRQRRRIREPWLQFGAEGGIHPDSYHPVIVDSHNGPPCLLAAYFESPDGEERRNCFNHPNELLGRVNDLMEFARRESSPFLDWNWEKIESPAMTTDSLAYYQALRCIDARRIGYQLRHLLQAVSICKLRLEGVPEKHFRGLLEGRTNEAYRHLLRNDVRMKPNRIGYGLWA